jgi:DNA-binding NtrC family response regulator
MSRTLIVDDHAAHARMLVERLQEAGFDACVATGLDEALARLRANQLGLVVTEIQVDGSDGFALLRAAQRMGHPVPVILMSSFGTAATLQQALAAGAYAYLRKPFALDDLVALVQRAHAPIIGPPRRASR